jgi:hypothetical protein
LQTEIKLSIGNSSRNGTAFLSLSVQKRIEALVSCTCTSGPKALALYIMATGKKYTQGELNRNAVEFLSSDLPFSSGILHGYCKTSLQPAGMVNSSIVTETMHSRRYLTAYRITQDGELYGKPSIARFILLAHMLNVSLNDLNGVTNSPGGYKHGYLVAKILEAIKDGKSYSLSSIAKNIGVDIVNIVGSALYELNRLGLVDYKSLNFRNFLHSSVAGYSVAKLKDRAKLEEYLKDENKLRSDVEKLRAFNCKWEYLVCALRLGLGELDRNILSEELGKKYADGLKVQHVRKNICSIVLSTMCDLGIYEYKGFIARKTKSEAIITERGLMAFTLAYEPILLVAKDPLSEYVSAEYRKTLQEIEPIIADLFREEMERFKKTSRHLHSRMPEETDRLVMGAVRRVELDSPFRASDLIRFGMDRKYRNSISMSLHRLAKSGHIEHTGIQQYYKLVRKERSDQKEETVVENSNSQTVP